MKSSKKITSVLLTLLVLVLSLGVLFACSDGVTVSFESDGGTSVSSITLNAGEAVSAPKNPTKSGYSFAGWKTEDGKLWDFNTPINEDLLLIAIWVKDDAASKATVKFDLKGGDTTNYPASATVTKGALLEEPPVPTKAGYSFAGWSYLGKKYDFKSSVVAGDFTLIAEWTPVVYEISYNLSGGTIDSPVTEYTTEADTAISVPTREGYKFLGWTFDGSSTPNASLVLKAGTTGNFALVANWSAVDYEINYELLGATITETPESYNAESESFVIPAPVKAHYDFIGWTVNGEGEPKLEVSVTKGSYGNLSLTANFKAHEYEIEYVLGEGAVNNEANPLFTSIESEEFTLLAPTLTGYKLKGWLVNGSEELVSEVTIQKGTCTSLKFEAVWELDTYAVTYFDFNGKLHSGEELVESFQLGQLPIKLPTLYLNNKCFVSWYTDVDFTNPITEITEYKDITVYAKLVDVSDGLTFTYNGTSYSLTGYTGTADVIYVPEIYNNQPVTAIGDGVFANSSIREIYLPKTIQSIGKEAFFGSLKLENVYLDEDTALISIGKSAFAGCKSIESFTAPKTLEIIDDGAFLGASSLKSIKLGGTALTVIGLSAFEGTALTEVELPASLEFICGNAFYNADKLTSVVFKDGSKLKSILTGAFKNCSSLKEILIPASVTSITSSAFENCVSLAKLTFAEDSKLDSIGASAFRNCDSLVSVTIPKGVAAVPEYAFYSNESLILVGFEKDSVLTSIGKSAFAETAISSVAFPEKLLEIAERAFENCAKLETVSFNEAIENIAKLAFNACSSLKGIELPKTCFAEDDSFLGCTAVEKLAINKLAPADIFGGKAPATLKTVTLFNEEFIKADSFEGCNAIESITLPFVGIVKYGTPILGECYSHADKVDKDSDGKCDYCLQCLHGKDDNKDSVCDKCSECITHTDKNGDGFCDVCVMCTSHEDKDSNGYCDKCSVQCKFISRPAEERDLKTLHTLFGGTVPITLKTVTVTGGECVAKEAFLNCENIETIVLPKETKIIGQNAFAGCTKLSYLEMPLSMSDVEDENFYTQEVEVEVEIWVEGQDEPKIETEIMVETVSKKTLTYLFDGNIPATLKTVVLYSYTENGEMPAGVFMDSFVRDVTLIGYSNISNSAFFGVKTLTKLDISESNIKVIGASAFQGCDNFKEFTVPASLETIEFWAFRESGLVKFDIASNARCRLTSIGEGAFLDCKKLYDVTLPASVTELQAELFKGCTALESVYIPKTVTSIGASAFEDCSALYEIVLAENTALTTIGNAAFKSSALKTFTVPYAVNVIPESAFENCASLKEIVFAAPAEEDEIHESYVIGINAFKNSALTAITLPVYVTEISDGAFLDCKALASVDFGKDSKLSVIGKGAFSNCDALKTIAIPDGVTALAEEIFKECDVLSSVTFSKDSKLEKILSYAFYNCQKLEVISVPKNVSEIGSYVFVNCYALKTVEIPGRYTVIEGEGEEAKEVTKEATLTVIGEGAFKNCDGLTAITLPASLLTLGDNAFFGCDKLVSVEFEDGAKINAISVSAFQGCVALKSFNVPDSVLVIANSAFQGCTALESVSFGEASECLNINENAFWGCTALKRFKAPTKLDSIGVEAFGSCTALESFEMTTRVKKLANYAFKNTPKLKILVVYTTPDAHTEWLNSEGLMPYWNTDKNEIIFLYVPKV